MNNYTETIGKRIKDRYKDGAIKLYDLCDYINKKAMNWYALKIDFNDEEVAIITKAQDTMLYLKDVIKKAEEDKDLLELLDLGYELYMHVCTECGGKVYVYGFATNHFNHNFNKYKCEECYKGYQDSHPNKPEDFNVYFEYYMKLANDLLVQENMKEAQITRLHEQIKEIGEVKNRIMNSTDEIKANRKLLLETVLETIEINGANYKELIKYKHHFDMNIPKA